MINHNIFVMYLLSLHRFCLLWPIAEICHVWLSAGGRARARASQDSMHVYSLYNNALAQTLVLSIASMCLDVN